jgi:hypothetical protein
LINGRVRVRRRSGHWEEAVSGVPKQRWVSVDERPQFIGTQFV